MANRARRKEGEEKRGGDKGGKACNEANNPTQTDPKAKIGRSHRSKVRASKRWMQQRSRNEAVVVVLRERNRLRTGDHGGLGRRKGGAGKRKVATPFTTNSCDDELMKDIGVPQYTWGDGSCWLWAVAGAMGKLEGTTGQTENGTQLERTWRRDIRATVLEHELPMTTEEIDKLEEGVQYEQGRLTKGGTWGGGTEHQAMAMMLKTNIVIWDRRYIGRVSANYKQIYICTPQGRMHLTNVAQAVGMLRGDVHTTIHLLYDYAVRHYEYFSRDTRQTTETTDEPNETKVKREVLQKEATEKQREGERRGEAEVNGFSVTGKDTPERQQIEREGPKGEKYGEHLLVIHIGTLN
eukprot:6201522-Pleurochrysis_carterae.AAC.1